MQKSRYTISKSNDLITLTPTSKHTQTLLFLHGWGESGAIWMDYFVSKDVLPEVNCWHFLLLLSSLGDQSPSPNSSRTLYQDI